MSRRLPGPASRASFRSDTRAGIEWWSVAQISALLLIPIALFVFWWLYLRRIGADEHAKHGPFGAPAKPAQAAPVGDETRTCGRCGLKVRPPKGVFPATCPNCMNVL